MWDVVVVDLGYFCKFFAVFIALEYKIDANVQQIDDAACNLEFEKYRIVLGFLECHHDGENENHETSLYDI